MKRFFLTVFFTLFCAMVHAQIVVYNINISVTTTGFTNTTRSTIRGWAIVDSANAKFAFIKMSVPRRHVFIENVDNYRIMPIIGVKGKTSQICSIDSGTLRGLTAKGITKTNNIAGIPVAFAHSFSITGSDLFQDLGNNYFNEYKGSFWWDRHNTVALRSLTFEQIVYLFKDNLVINNGFIEKWP